jgi:hypothetical protein
MPATDSQKDKVPVHNVNGQRLLVLQAVDQSCEILIQPRLRIKASDRNALRSTARL